MPFTIQEGKNIITPIAQAHGVKSVSLFGSYSRGHANADSDVDLKIEKGQLRTLFQLCGFRLAVEDALQCPVDLVTSESPILHFWKGSRKMRCCSMEQRDKIILQKIVAYCERIAGSL